MSIEEWTNEGRVDRSAPAEERTLVNTDRSFEEMLAEVREIAAEHGVNHRFPDHESDWTDADYATAREVYAHQPIRNNRSRHQRLDRYQPLSATDPRRYKRRRDF